MNNILETYARDWLKINLAILPKSSHEMFKRMYADGNMELDINIVVDKMPQKRLDWAMVQVQNSLVRLAKER